MPSDRLRAELADAEKLGLFTGKAKSEFIIAPILLEVWRRASDKISLFSGAPLVVEQAGLGGFCDFVLSANPQSYELSTPIFCLVEAKNRTLEGGLGQCAAEMYAAYLLNEQQQTPMPTIYGAVTNGFEWMFLALTLPDLYIDNRRFYLNEVEEVLGVFERILEEAFAKS